MSIKLGAGPLVAATASVLQRQGRAMLAAAPWSLAAFTLTLPFALTIFRVNRPSDLLWAALALINLIALARMTYAWHRIAAGGEASRLPVARSGSGEASRLPIARGGSGEARHLVLLSAIAIVITALARATGDLPYAVYMLLDAPSDGRFYAALLAALAVIWLPVLYALAVYGVSLPRTAVTGEYGLGGVRAPMHYPRWPLMVCLLALIAMASFAAINLEPLTYGGFETDHWPMATLSMLLCVPITFVVTAMYAVAYRDSVGVAHGGT
ncbi:hypothetical protein [Achromobacter kerstersii]|uniref:hypothetical protein n=1 Tax=Achromobacter kerstersii TaxID=1353890 RepID=UPI003D021EA4